MEDRRGKLNEEVFSCQVTKDGKALIYWQGKCVMTLKGDKAQKLIGRIEAADDHEAQMIMAKATGNFKRGNERHGGEES